MASTTERGGAGVESEHTPASWQLVRVLVGIVIWEVRHLLVFQRDPSKWFDGTLAVLTELTCHIIETHNSHLMSLLMHQLT